MLFIFSGLLVMLATDTLAWAFIGLFIMIYGLTRITDDDRNI